MTELPPDDGIPVLPYAGSSGYSGSDTSRERAERDDSDGTTSARQRRVIALLDYRGTRGATWKEVADILGLHHGQASGSLSNLHKVGRISRLRQTRERCKVYVLREYLDGRDEEVQGRSNPDAALEIDMAMAMNVIRQRGYSQTSDMHAIEALLARYVIKNGPLDFPQ